MPCYIISYNIMYNIMVYYNMVRYLVLWCDKRSPRLLGPPRAPPSPGRRSAAASPYQLSLFSEFRDVVFEDVVSDNNSSVTPYQVTTVIIKHHILKHHIPELPIIMITITIPIIIIGLITILISKPVIITLSIIINK